MKKYLIWIIPCAIVITWCAIGFCKFNTSDPSWIHLLFLHLMFFVPFLISSIVSLKIFVLQVAREEKEAEFERKIKWEESQKANYKEQQQERVESNNLEKQIKIILASLLEEQQRTYNQNLETLKSNVKLYNEAKKIIESHEEIRNKEQ